MEKSCSVISNLRKDYWKCHVCLQRITPAGHCILQFEIYLFGFEAFIWLKNCLYTLYTACINCHRNYTRVNRVKSLSSLMHLNSKLFSVGEFSCRSMDKTPKFNVLLGQKLSFQARSAAVHKYLVSFWRRWVPWSLHHHVFGVCFVSIWIPKMKW